jgi:hypothetical protein
MYWSSLLRCFGTDVRLYPRMHVSSLGGLACSADPVSQLREAGVITTNGPISWFGSETFRKIIIFRKVRWFECFVPRTVDENCSELIVFEFWRRRGKKGKKTNKSFVSFFRGFVLAPRVESMHACCMHECQLRCQQGENRTALLG